jgi:beta-mannosidase
VRDIVIAADRLDPAAGVSEQLVTLLPGEGAVVEVRGSRRFGAQELGARPVLQCVNHFSARPG